MEVHGDLFEWKPRKKRYKTFDQKAYMRQYQIDNAEKLKANFVIWAAKNKDKLQANSRGYGETMWGRAQVLRNAAMTRAKKKNEAFTLTHQEIHDGIAQGYCQRTGVPFQMKFGIRLEQGKGMHPNSPSIDKINPFGIYETGNVQYVCAWYNMAKGQMTDAEMLELCKTTVEFNR